MYSTSHLFRIKNILHRIASGEEINFQERLYIDNCADKDQAIATSLRRARRVQQKMENTNSLDHLINDLDLASIDPDSSYKPKVDDLGEWFSGAPSWLGRS